MRSLEHLTTLYLTNQNNKPFMYLNCKTFNFISEFKELESLILDIPSLPKFGLKKSNFLVSFFPLVILSMLTPLALELCLL